MRSKYFLCLSALGALLMLRAADTPVNLLRADGVEPVYMHGRITAFRGIMMNDSARTKYIAKHRKYISGEECFTLDAKDGEATIAFPDPLPAPYAENPGPQIQLYVGMDPQPPAATYRVSGRVKLDKGELRLSNGPKFGPSSDWRKFDYQGRPFFISITPAAGAHIGFADLRMTPVYPEVGGAIALPDGGRLTKFLLARDADFVTRWGVAMWRGWLWKLSGVALPIETVDRIEPAAGTFAALQDKTLERGWELKVDASGIVLRYRERDDLAPALFDYLRMGLGCAFYAPDCEKLPPLPVAKLPAIDRKVVPRYKAMLHTCNHLLLSGGKLRSARYMHGDTDYCHSPVPKWDHAMNILLPQEMYYRKHPEYYMMNTSGQRVVAHHPFYTHQCFSNRDARKIILDSIAAYAKAQNGPTRMCLEPGDTRLFCLCPDCVAFNGTKATNSDLLMDFSNDAAATLEKVDPEYRFVRAAYLNRCHPPRKVRPKDNIDLFFCLTDDVMPCTLHADCEKNRKGLKMAAEWKRLLGDDPGRMGYMTYDDARPLQITRIAEYLNSFGSGDFYVFQWHYTPVAVQFVLPRWNLGEDADKLMEEFDLNYYGKAGKAMHKITLFIDEWGKNYRHHAGEGAKTSLFCGHRSCRTTVLDRAAFDRIYALFDEAVAAAGDDKTLRGRIFEEKKFVLAEDFNRFGPASCGTDAELKAFIGRFADFIMMAREAPRRFGGITPDQEMRNFILSATGISIPDTGKVWANEPFVDRFLAAPERFFRGADKIPGGWYFKPLAMRGAGAPYVYAYQCPPRYCVGLRRAGCGSASVTLKMDLESAPEFSSCLAVEGQDDDKAGTSAMRVAVNGTAIFSGPVAFPERAWGRMGFNIPAGVLKAGENTIVISNITPDAPSRSERFAEPAAAAKDPQWGWIAVSEVYWLDPADDFARLLERKFDTPWGYHDGNSRGQVSPHIRDGKAIADAGEMAPCYYTDHLRPKIAITPGERVRLEVKASGRGKLYLGLWNYRPYRTDRGIAPAGYGGERTKMLPHLRSPAFALSDTPRYYRFEFVPPEGTGLIIPHFHVAPDSRAEATEFRIELLPPKK